MLSPQLPDSTLSFWGNNFVGKNVQIASAIFSMAGGPVALTGKLVRIDRFQYRYYAVIEQKEEKLVHVNIDHIFAIEEVI